MTFAARALEFHRSLHYTGDTLPAGIRVMNPFKEYAHTLGIAGAFFNRFFNDNLPRHLIMGINPGRLGAGLTGIPFTDPKRLTSECNIPYEGRMAHEPSSVFVYEMIHAYGGVESFYRNFYISSPCPLGFTALNDKGKEVNYNYYDSKSLIAATTPFMIDTIHKLIALGIDKDTCFCLGTGKNARFLQQLNKTHGFFQQIIPLEHPRYIMQYKNRVKDQYIDKYLAALRSVKTGS